MMSDNLQVLQKAKQLGIYIFMITENSPKKYRFTLVSRMQNLALDIVENMFKANRVSMVVNNLNALKLRRKYQREASISTETLGYIALIARERQCITPEQYKNISKALTEIIRMIHGWGESDYKRFKNFG